MFNVTFVLTFWEAIRLVGPVTTPLLSFLLLPLLPGSSALPAALRHAVEAPAAAAVALAAVQQVEAVLGRHLEKKKKRRMRRKSSRQNRSRVSANADANSETRNSKMNDHRQFSGCVSHPRSIFSNLPPFFFFLFSNLRLLGLRVPGAGRSPSPGGERGALGAAGRPEGEASSVHVLLALVQQAGGQRQAVAVDRLAALARAAGKNKERDQTRDIIIERVN